MYQQKPTDSSEVTLINCDQELIHIPGSIQPHGVLLVLDKNDFTIFQVSENVSAVLHREANDLLGRPISALLNEEQTKIFSNETSHVVTDKQNAFLKTIISNPLK